MVGGEVVGGAVVGGTVLGEAVVGGSFEPRGFPGLGPATGDAEEDADPGTAAAPALGAARPGTAGAGGGAPTTTWGTVVGAAAAVGASSAGDTPVGPVVGRSAPLPPTTISRWTSRTTIVVGVGPSGRYSSRARSSAAVAAAIEATMPSIAPPPAPAARMRLAMAGWRAAISTEPEGRSETETPGR